MTITTGTPRDSAWRRRSAVLREILLSGPISRTEAARNVGLGRSTVSRIVHSLIEAGFVRELPDSRERRARVGSNRHFMFLGVNPQGGQVLGIGIGPSSQTITLANLDNTPIATVDLNLNALGDPKLVFRQIARQSRSLIGEHLTDRSRLLGGLVAVTASVDQYRGDILDAPYLGWDSFPARAELAEFLDLPMRVHSMTAAIAHAEHLFGATRGRTNVLTLLCGLGIGAAVILDGQLMQESAIPIGGIGMMEVTAENGTIDTLDQLASGIGVLKRLHGVEKTATRTPLHEMAYTLLAVVKRDRTGETAVAETLSRAGRELGRFIVDVARYVAPESVLIAGPLSQSPSYMSAIGSIVAEKAPHFAPEVMAGPVSAQSASSAMAVVEYLIERPVDLSLFSVQSPESNG